MSRKNHWICFSLPVDGWVWGLGLVGCRLAFSITTGYLVPLSEDWAIFWSFWSFPSEDGLAKCDQLGRDPLKFFAKTIELGPRRRQTVRCIHSPTELSWPRPQGGQTVRYIHSLTELSRPRAWRGQAVRYIHSLTELSWPREWRGQTVRYIHSLTELSRPRAWRGQAVLVVITNKPKKNYSNILVQQSMAWSLRTWKPVACFSLEEEWVAHLVWDQMSRVRFQVCLITFRAQH